MNKLIGVFLKGSNISRTYPHMTKVIELLEKGGYQTIILDKVVENKYEYSTSEVAALVEQCDVVVSSNTFGLHLAGALGKRGVALFGSCEGTVWTEDYEKVIPVDISCPKKLQNKCWWELKCIPGGNLREKEVKEAPPCLSEIPIEMIVEKVDSHFKAKKVLVVILTYNLLYLTKQMADSIRSFHDYEILIIDNDSKDGTQEWAEDMGYDIISEPMSVPMAWNLGQQVAYDLGYDYALLCNNDCILSPSYIDTVVECAERRQAIAVTGQVINKSESTQSHFSELVRDIEVPITDMKPGDYSALLLSRECYEKIGAFKRFAPRYQSDEDHLLRLRLYGAGLTKTFQTSFFHKHGAVVNELPEAIATKDKEWKEGIKAFKKEWGFEPYQDRHKMFSLSYVKEKNKDWKDKIYRKFRGKDE